MARREEIIKRQDEAIRSLEVNSDTFWLLRISLRLSRVIIASLLLEKMMHGIQHVTFLSNSCCYDKDLCYIHSIPAVVKFKALILSTKLKLLINKQEKSKGDMLVH